MDFSSCLCVLGVLAVAFYRELKDPTPANCVSMATADPANQGILRTIGRALRHRNYRLFFAGQLVSLIGTFLTQAATVWLVYRLTGDAWLLGVVGFAGQIPMFVLSPFAGVWADR